MCIQLWATIHILHLVVRTDYHSPDSSIHTLRYVPDLQHKHVGHYTGAIRGRLCVPYNLDVIS
jgi:hypothetical protein